MRFVIDIDPDGQEFSGPDAEQIIRRRLEAAETVNVQGFTGVIVGELPGPDAGHVQFFDGEGHLGGTSLPDGRGPVMADIPAGATRLTVTAQRPPVPVQPVLAPPSWNQFLIVDRVGMGRPDQVEVRYVIEAEPNQVVMWSALADDSEGIDEGFARAAFDGFVSSKRLWRLVRRTSVITDEVLESSHRPGDLVTYRAVHADVEPHRARVEGVEARGLVVVDEQPGMPLEHLVTWDRVLDVQPGPA